MSDDDDNYFDTLVEEYQQKQLDERFKFRTVKYTAKDHSKLKYKKICARGKAIEIASMMRDEPLTMDWPASKRQKVAASMAYYPGTIHGPLDRDQTLTVTEVKATTVDHSDDDEFADRCDRLFWGTPDWNAKNYKDFLPSPVRSPAPSKKYNSL